MLCCTNIAIIEPKNSEDDLHRKLLFALCKYCFDTFCRVRSSRPEVLCKNGVLKSFAKSTGKHL